MGSLMTRSRLALLHTQGAAPHHFGAASPTSRTGACADVPKSRRGDSPAAAAQQSGGQHPGPGSTLPRLTAAHFRQRRAVFSFLSRALSRTSIGAPSSHRSTLSVQQAAEADACGARCTQQRQGATARQSRCRVLLSLRGDACALLDASRARMARSELARHAALPGAFSGSRGEQEKGAACCGLRARRRLRRRCRLRLPPSRSLRCSCPAVLHRSRGSLGRGGCILRRAECQASEHSPSPALERLEPLGRSPGAVRKS